MSAARASNRPNPLLLGLLGVVAVVAAWRYLPSFGGGPGFTRTTTADLRSTAIDVVELAAYTLDQPPPPSRPTRDPWSFGTRPAPEATAEPVAPPPPEPLQPAVRETPAPPVIRDTPAPEALGPKPPPIDVFYIGSFGRSDNPIAVFVDADKSIFNALEGDLVKDKFEVQNIGYESVDLLFVGFPDEQPVRLAIGGRPEGS
ncbi:MAG: hypothetical protein F4210_09350 [Holophagales bacterium]|nr:hypothetical protein [Holophagales bacterium]MYF95697.1 hypothetical protein [Holophagales bacterium]